MSRSEFAAGCLEAVNLLEQALTLEFLSEMTAHCTASSHADPPGV